MLNSSFIYLMVSIRLASLIAMLHPGHQARTPIPSIGYYPNDWAFAAPMEASLVENVTEREQ
jgi:hypothetical protein